MRRTVLIAIGSLTIIGQALGSIPVGWYYGSSEYFDLSPGVVAYARSGIYFAGTLTLYRVGDPNPVASWSPSWSTYNSGTVVHRGFTVSVYGDGVYYFSGDGSQIPDSEQFEVVDGAVQLYESTVTKVFAWNFPPNWGGTVVQIKDPSGNVYATLIVPDGGGVLEGSVTAPSGIVDSLSVHLDGYPASALAMVPAEADIGETDLERPSYEFNFDETYGGQEWVLRRPDGTVIGYGYVTPDGDYVALASFVTDTGNSPAEVYTRYTGGDGVATEWQPTGVTVGGNGTTSHSFVNGTVAPEPSDAAEVVPAPSPFPAVSPPVSSGSGVSFPAGSTDSEIQEVADFEAEGPDNENVDDGEEQILAQAEGIAETWSEIGQTVIDIDRVLKAIVGKWQAAANVSPDQSVGQECQFQFGSATVNLSPYSGYRTATGAMAWFFAALAFHSLIIQAKRK